MNSILFVCLGNICRSPAAEGIFRSLSQAAGKQFTIDSAGTSGWHSGETPDQRMQETMQARGYDISNLHARQVVTEDFNKFDLILAMDGENLSNLRRIQPRGSHAKIVRMLDFSAGHKRDVPDPYYGGPDGFTEVIDLLEESCKGLLADLG